MNLEKPFKKRGFNLNIQDVGQKTGAAEIWYQQQLPFNQKNQGVDQQNYGSYQPVKVANNDWSGHLSFGSIWHVYRWTSHGNQWHVENPSLPSLQDNQRKQSLQLSWIRTWSWIKLSLSTASLRAGNSKNNCRTAHFSTQKLPKNMVISSRPTAGCLHGPPHHGESHPPWGDMDPPWAAYSLASAKIMGVHQQQLGSNSWKNFNGKKGIHFLGSIRVS